MRRKFVVRASKNVCSKQPIKAATSADMLAAFEERLADLGVSSKTNIECASESKEVPINDSDYDQYYTDNEGGFGEDGETYSLGEIKTYWNANYDNDPILVEYPDFDSWWSDTYSNYLVEQY